MTDERPPIRLERDGDVAAIVLDEPAAQPLQPTTPSTARSTCLDEVEGSDARALVWRAEGDIFTGGVDVNVFQRIVDAGAEAAERLVRPADRARCSGSRRSRSRRSRSSTASA